MTRSRKGDFAEYYAVTWLWDRGYEVFKNTGCSGAIDLVAVNPKGKIILIDVKTLQRDHRSADEYYHVVSSRTPYQKNLKVKLLGFNPKTRELRFIDHVKDGEIKLDKA